MCWDGITFCFCISLNYLSRSINHQLRPMTLKSNTPRTHAHKQTHHVQHAHELSILIYLHGYWFGSSDDVYINKNTKTFAYIENDELTKTNGVEVIYSISRNDQVNDTWEKSLFIQFECYVRFTRWMLENTVEMWNLFFNTSRFICFSCIFTLADIQNVEINFQKKEEALISHIKVTCYKMASSSTSTSYANNVNP